MQIGKIKIQPECNAAYWRGRNSTLPPANEVLLWRHFSKQLITSQRLVTVVFTRTNLSCHAVNLIRNLAQYDSM